MLNGLFIILMSFQLSYMQGNTAHAITLYETDYRHLELPLCGEFEVEATILKYFFIRGKMNSVFYFVDLAEGNGLTFSPDNNTYDVTAGIRLGILELGYNQTCNHPQYAWKNNEYNFASLEYAYREVYIKVQGKLIDF
jgi:hypothetical protein